MSNGLRKSARYRSTTRLATAAKIALTAGERRQGREMCALCGVMGGRDHWTEPSWRAGVYVRHSDPAARRRERAQRIRSANVILGLFGLTVSDWGAAAYLLSTRTGKTEVVADLAALWPTAEKLAGRPLDPLAPDILDRRERAHV